jgi:adenylate cyclase
VAEERVQTRLVPILAADVAGYIRLMRVNEAATQARLYERLNDVITPFLADNRARLVKFVGDGILIEFNSVVNAVRCAVNIQNGVAARQARELDYNRLQIRKKINLGDVAVEGDDIDVDGVYFTTRLENQFEVII